MSVNLCKYEAQNISYIDLEKLGENAYYEIKYDGTHICLKYEADLKINTRNDIPHDKGYQNLFYQVPGIEQVINYIKENDQYILHGELVHKKTSGMQIHANEIPQFILYDIFDKENNKYIEPLNFDNEIFFLQPIIYLETDYILQKVLKERLEGIVAKSYNQNIDNCTEGKNFNLCLFKYKPYYATLGVIFKPVRKEIDTKKLSFLLGEIDNDLKYGKNDWKENHPELLNFFIENKEKILKILQNNNIVMQIEKDTHLDIRKIKEYITNFT